MRILVIGSGAREHAIVLALAGGPDRGGTKGSHDLHAAPGNPGIGKIAHLHEVDPLDGKAVATLAVGLQVDLVVVGPEAPLVAGVADDVRAAGIACFGPGAEAAALEGSKAFAKDVMAAAGVPTAMARVCTTEEELTEAIDAFGPPYVVKDDGLAAGKGVVVTSDRREALEHGRSCLHRSDEGASGAVVIEEYLDGPEVSIFCLSDGTTVVPLCPAQDFKRAHDGDLGPNTGGMGAYSPLTWAPPGLVDEVVERIALPTIAEMRRRGTPFVGVLYCGLALTSRGVRVIEFNARFGDPETQVVLARLVTPLAEVLLAAATGGLDRLPPLRWRPEAAVTVVVAAKGYPEAPVSGVRVKGVKSAEQLPSVHVLHAGTAKSDGDLVSAGGRVLSVVGMGKDVRTARAAAYEGVERIRLKGSHHRKDIAATMPTGVGAGAVPADAAEATPGPEPVEPTARA